MALYELFLQILNMSLTASVVILLVLVLRRVLRRAPKIFSYALWLVVLTHGVEERGRVLDGLADAFGFSKEEDVLFEKS